MSNVLLKLFASDNDIALISQCEKINKLFIKQKQVARNFETNRVGSGY